MTGDRINIGVADAIDGHLLLGSGPALAQQSQPDKPTKGMYVASYI